MSKNVTRTSGKNRFGTTREPLARLLMGAAIALTLALAPAAPAWAQDGCNSKLDLEFGFDADAGVGGNISRLIGEMSEPVTIRLENDGGQDQEFEKVDFFPSCLDIGGDPNCTLFDEGEIPGGLPAISLVNGSLDASSCPQATVTATEFLPSGRVEFSFDSASVPGRLPLAVGEACSFEFQLSINELGAGVTPDEQYQVDNLVQTAWECPSTGSASSNSDSSAVTYFDCVPALSKQVRCADSGFFGESCVGWDGEPVEVKYTVTNAALSSVGSPIQCDLSESNTALGTTPSIPNAIPAGEIRFRIDDDQTCSDTLDDLEPDTATASCVCLLRQDLPPIVIDDGANFECQESGVTLTKECLTQNGAGENEITLTVSNPDPDNRTADLANCVVTDPLAGYTSAPFDLAAGGSVDLSTSVAGLTQDTLNSASVECDVVGAPGKTVSDEATDMCEVAVCDIQLDRQVSCDGGQTWTDAGDPSGSAGFDDGVIDTCVGDPTDDIRIRWVAVNNSTISGQPNPNVECELTDGNPFLGVDEFGVNVPIPPPGVILERNGECSSILDGEPDGVLALLSCTCFDESGEVEIGTDEDSDIAGFSCTPPDLEVEKVCEPGFNEQTGLYEYTVTATNTGLQGAADLTQCVIDDSTADCGPLSSTTIAQGQSATATCTSRFKTNEVSVTCETEGGPITRTAEAECTPPTITLDKQVSCDGGATWHGVGPEGPGGPFDSCTGWTTGPPEVLARWIATSSGGVVENCVLDDTNKVLLPNPVDVGDQPDGEIYRVPMPVECNPEAAGWMEPDNATLSCSCPVEPGVADPLEAEDWANIECATPDLTVVKECATVVDPTTNQWVYEIEINNSGDAPLENCEAVDPNAPDCDRSFATLAPGQIENWTCASDYKTNQVTVTCDIAGTVDKTITRTDEAECTPDLEVDKQVSCDGGATWNDVGFDDPDGAGGIAGCEGWRGGPPEVKVRYLAQSFGYLTGCDLTDTNTAILAGSTAVGDFPDGVIYETDLIECNPDLPGWAEPNTATLSCDCARAPGDVERLSDSDTADLECTYGPELRVTKECADDVDPQTGEFVYTVRIENIAPQGGAPLTNCSVSDTSASGCDRAPGSIGPIAAGGGFEEITCTSIYYTNTATVSCEGPKGPDFPLTDEASDECLVTLEVDKRVSCDSGATWQDVGYTMRPTGPRVATRGGSRTNMVEGCTGWTNGGPDERVKVAYFARTRGWLTNCVLTDTNTVFIPDGGVQIDHSSELDGMIFESELVECNPAQVGWEEPNTATLVCECLPAPGESEPFEDSDTAEIDCRAANLSVEKECAADVDPQTGEFIYTVRVENPDDPIGAGLDTCLLSDPGTDCDGTNLGSFEPGDSTVIECRTFDSENLAEVTCDIRDAFEPDGSAKTISRADEAVCFNCPPKLTFEELAPGTVVTDQFAAGWGVTISTLDQADHPAMIFNSANPTGGDDDLGTTNEDFGGPGEGTGGEFGEPGQNSIRRGNVLIISEDNDSSDPDDDANGGTIVFDFASAVEVHSVGILDIDFDETGTVTAYDGDGVELASVFMQSLGDNSQQDVPLGVTGVRKIEVWFQSSGSVTDIFFCPEYCVEEAINDPRVQPADAGHAFYLPGISTEFIFEPSGGFVEFDDGTASLTGTIWNLFDIDESFSVDVQLSGKTDVAGPGSPKKEMSASAYVENGGPVDPATWFYYQDYTGTLTGLDDFAGAEILIVPTGPNFQMGKGANNKNTNPGASTWFDWTVTSQPTQGRTLPTTGVGDINIEILCECIELVCIPMDWLDRFDWKEYDNNDGSTDWSGPWIEEDDHPDNNGQDPHNGYVHIIRDTNAHFITTRSLRMYGQTHSYIPGGPSIRRSVDLSGKATATLMFDWELGWDVDPDDEAVLEISGDGGATWSTLETWTGYDQNSSSDSGSSVHDVTQWISPQTTIRFRIAAYYGGSDEFFFVDNVKITSECP